MGPIKMSKADTLWGFLAHFANKRFGLQVTEEWRLLCDGQTRLDPTWVTVGLLDSSCAQQNQRCVPSPRQQTHCASLIILQVAE